MGGGLEGFKSLETIGGERNTVGSKYRLRFSKDVRDFKMTDEMNEFRSPEAIAFHLDSDVVADDVRVRFSDSSSKTEAI